jgi:ATPase subunit of ABC transporter with duplicated ATPase domains
MSRFLGFSNLSAVTPDRRPLFHDLNLSIGQERIGLVGRNGSGKSTLLRIAAGLAEPATGHVTRTGTAAMLAQEWPAGDSVAQALGVATACARLDRILAGDGTGDDFEQADWTLPARIDAALAEVGLAALPRDRTIGSLSGGERTRIGLARLAIERPDLLLLDEPTNNLDAAGRALVHRLVADWRGGMLVASHDRALLETMDRIVELNPVAIRIVGGGWSAFAAQRDAERTAAHAERDRSDHALRETARRVQSAQEAKDRRDKAGRAYAAKGAQPKILLGAQAERAENSGGRAHHLADRLLDDATARLDEAKARIEIVTPLTITLPPSGLPSGADLLALDAVTLDAGDRRLGPWTLAIRGPERIALAGANGTGKTSLLQVASGLRMPASGMVRRAEGRIALLDQHVGLLDADATILANLRRHHPTLDAEAAYAACARFAFRNRDARQLVGSLSGGERLRAGLAVAFSGPRPPWLLMLDEPTNHLDIESIELLEHALRDYDGALLVVSHDRRFLDAIGIDREYRLG